MVVRFDDHLSIYFGTAHYALNLDEIITTPFHNFVNHPSLQHIGQSLSMSKFFFPKQIHGIAGYAVRDTVDAHNLFDREGDFVVTNILQLGLGIVTADCLPIIIYDPINKAFGTIHAGWRGSINGIVDKTLCVMNTAYGTRTHQVKIFFGPGARSCCYQVQPDFIDRFIDSVYRDKSIRKRNGNYFFDAVAYNQQRLDNRGVLSDSYIIDNSICTICNIRFYSYRRQKEQAGRQITMVVLV